MLVAAAALIALTWALCLGLAWLDGDAAVYALLAKRMVLTGDWSVLYFQGADWLDKPHFPFWTVALSFSVFGLNEQAYLLPGLVFYTLGAWFTYLLARELFDRSVASLAVLLFASTFALMLTAGDQKAEVYLLALMTGASYAWVRFGKQTAWRWWLLGSVLTGCALMTKGVFVLLFIGVGLVAQAFAQRRWRCLLHLKWLAAGLGAAIFTAPELLALYQQFGASGIKFFFWDSQFGRFFNTGPIKNQGGSPYFYLHNLLWTLLPWSVLLVRSLWFTALNAKALWGPSRQDSSGSLAFVWATFIAAFVLFSATRFQMDYYLTIVFAYLLIALANSWLSGQRGQQDPGVLKLALWQRLQKALAIAVFLAAVGLFAISEDGTIWALGVAGAGSAVGIAGMIWSRNRARADLQTEAETAAFSSPWTRMLAWPLVAVVSLFAFVQFNHHQLYQRYEIGRHIAATMSGKPQAPTFVYGRALKGLDFFGAVPALPVYDMAPLATSLRKPGASGAYLVIEAGQQASQLANLQALLMLPGDNTVQPGKLRIVKVQDFQEARLSPQFVRRLLTRDADLPRQTLSLLYLDFS
jgi:4-amino-4-deoxy-L-arabinose transferase-like glycosyltransferase